MFTKIKGIIEKYLQGKIAAILWSKVRFYFPAKVEHKL